MAPKKDKTKKRGRPSKGARHSYTLRISDDLAIASAKYIAVTGEDMSTFAQRLIREHLTAQGFWSAKKAIPDAEK